MVRLAHVFQDNEDIIEIIIPKEENYDFLYLMNKILEDLTVDCDVHVDCDIKRGTY